MENSRRLFLKTSISLIGIITIPSFLQAKKNINTNLSDLTAFCYVLYPHKGLDIKYYEKCAKNLLRDKSKNKILLTGIKRLNALYNQPFSSLKYINQKKVIQYISSVDNRFFTLVKNFLITGLYGNKETWDYFGYEGASFSKGGYLNRGFDDIKWLKKDKL